MLKPKPPQSSFYGSYLCDRIVHQDHLTGTSLATSANGTSLGSIKYYPYGYRRNSQGDLGTDKLFTGQRLDDTGLYYFGARYYDPAIGRFISPDPIVQSPANPQSLNRYSYVLNNPLKYIDPSGNVVSLSAGDVEIPLYLWESDDPMVWVAVNAMIMAGGGQSVVEEMAEQAMGWYEFEGDYGYEANVMEASKLEYVVTSSSTSMSDMHIINRQTINDMFSLLAPYASGYVDFTIVTDWYQGDVTTTVSSYISNIYPGSSTIYCGATVKMPGPDAFIHLSEPGIFTVGTTGIDMLRDVSSDDSSSPDLPVDNEQDNDISDSSSSNDYWWDYYWWDYWWYYY